MRLKVFERPCRHCKTPFVGNRMLKYCGPACREDVAKKQRAAYERRAQRGTYLSRKQFELVLDMPSEQPYKDVP